MSRAFGLRLLLFFVFCCAASGVFVALVLFASFFSLFKERAVGLARFASGSCLLSSSLCLRFLLSVVLTFLALGSCTSSSLLVCGLFFLSLVSLSLSCFKLFAFSSLLSSSFSSLELSSSLLLFSSRSLCCLSSSLTSLSNSLVLVF